MKKIRNVFYLAKLYIQHRIELKKLSKEYVENIRTNNLEGNYGVKASIETELMVLKVIKTNFKNLFKKEDK